MADSLGVTMVGIECATLGRASGADAQALGGGGRCCKSWVKSQVPLELHLGRIEIKLIESKAGALQTFIPQIFIEHLRWARHLGLCTVVPMGVHRHTDGWGWEEEGSRARGDGSEWGGA